MTVKRPMYRAVLRQRGINLVELMITLLLAGVIVAAAVVMTVHYSQNNAQQERLVDLQNNLRMASEHISTRLRRSGYATPLTIGALISATGWPSFTENPTVIQGDGTAPDQLILVSCSARPQALLNASLAKGDTSLSLMSAVPDQSIDKLFNTKGRSLLRLMAGSDVTSGFARVESVSGSSLEIVPIVLNPDTPPRGYFANTPVCRLDITHYQVSVNKTLQIHQYRDQWDDWQDVTDGIVDLQVTRSGPTFTIILTGETPEAKPVMRKQAFSVTLRNP